MEKVIKHWGYCYDALSWNICPYLKNKKCNLFNSELTENKALPECNLAFGADYEDYPTEIVVALWKNWNIINVVKIHTYKIRKNIMRLIIILALSSLVIAATSCVHMPREYAKLMDNTVKSNIELMKRADAMTDINDKMKIYVTLAEENNKTITAVANTIRAGGGD